MKSFQFEPIRPHPSGKGTVGNFELHVQCPWRILSMMVSSLARPTITSPPPEQKNPTWMIVRAAISSVSGYSPNSATTTR